MIDPVCCYLITADLNRLARFYLYKFKHGIGGAWYYRKIRPHLIIQKIVFQCLQHRRNPYNCNVVPLVFYYYIVCKERDSFNVVEMGMGYNNMAYLPLGILRQGSADSSGIKQQTAINQKSGRME